MSNIHYFPRYSQKENMVTNNTLLLFSRLYNNSPEKFARLINAILEESGIELDTMVRFKQQEKATGGRIPDGVIEQESFKVVIETKLYGQEHIEQIKGHWTAFKNEDKQIFLWVNKEPILNTYHQLIIDALNQYNDKNKSEIGFASTTFKDICSCFNDIIQEYDLEMKALIDVMKPSVMSLVLLIMRIQKLELYLQDRPLSKIFNTISTIILVSVGIKTVNT